MSGYNLQTTNIQEKKHTQPNTFHYPNTLLEEQVTPGIYFSQ